MTGPIVIEDRSVCWCPTCSTAVKDEPEWAAEHHDLTGHQTARRSWSVERYEIQEDA